MSNKIKEGTKVFTPDGSGEVCPPIGKAPDDNRILVKINSDKYWPHWNIYYDINEVRVKKQQ
jgi:hypothetical protein